MNVLFFIILLFISFSDKAGARGGGGRSRPGHALGGVLWGDVDDEGVEETLLGPAPDDPLR